MRNIEIISASAGSGKTYRLTELLEAGVVNGGVRPHAVLATTFTNKSAAELQERVRSRLLAAGRTSDAHQLTAARIGTVNAVCGRLVTEHAFELGLSPELHVLDEEAAISALNQQISQVLTPELETELAELGERMPELDWQKAICRVVSLARSNGVAATDLQACAQRSWAEYKQLFGKPTETADVLDAVLADTVKRFLSGVAKNGDKTKGTRKAVDRVQKVQRQLQRRQTSSMGGMDRALEALRH